MQCMCIAYVGCILNFDILEKNNRAYVINFLEVSYEQLGLCNVYVVHVFICIPNLIF